MLRPSTLSSRPSALPPGRVTSSTQSATLRLLEKRQEWEAIAALDETTEEIVKSLEQLAAQGNIMADGGRGESDGHWCPALSSSNRPFSRGVSHEQLAQRSKGHQLIR